MLSLNMNGIEVVRIIFIGHVLKQRLTKTFVKLTGCLCLQKKTKIQIQGNWKSADHFFTVVGFKYVVQSFKSLNF